MLRKYELQREIPLRLEYTELVLRLYPQILLEHNGGCLSNFNYFCKKIWRHPTFFYYPQVNFNDGYGFFVVPQNHYPQGFYFKTFYILLLKYYYYF